VARLAAFTVAASMGAVHDREVIGGRKASVLDGKFRAVDTLIGNVKTALAGPYHAIESAGYGHPDLAEMHALQPPYALISRAISVRTASIALASSASARSNAAAS
jgi:hypothetical protein